MIGRVLILAACICWSSQVHADSHQQGDTFPAFVWSNQPYFQHEQQISRVSYQVFDGLSSIVPGWLSAALSLDNKAGAGHQHFQWADAAARKPELLVVVVGKQVSSRDLSSQNAAPAVAQLKTLLKGAASSIALPYIRRQFAHGKTADEEVIALLEESRLDFQTVNCGSAAADGFLQQALGKDALGSNSETRVVLVCSKADVEAQQQELAEVARLAEASGLHYQLMLVSAPDAPDAPESLSARRRSLLAAVSGFGPYKECGPVCQTQVRWLEGIIALGMMSLAAICGLCCMYALNTPTRFQAPKEGRSD